MAKRYKGKGSIIAGLDIGSSKISCLIARVIDDEGQFEVVGAGHQASHGVKSGTIIDVDAAEAAIRHTVHAAENMAADSIKGYPLRDVLINLPGVHSASRRMQVDVQISGQDITQNDVNRALSKAHDQVQDKEDNSEIVHTIPADFAIDGNKGIRSPVGMFGQELSVDVHMVTGELNALRNIATCVERSHLDISALCLSSYAAGLSCLVEDEMDLGCTVVDIGGGVTSFAVFQGGKMIHSDAVPLGGLHITSDIARGLTTSLVDAERLKTLYGSAVATMSDESEVIDVPQVGEAAGSNLQTQPHYMPRSLLVGIMQPRMEEIFELVRARLADSPAGINVGRRVVLTGGVSQTQGIKDLAQHVLDKQVRLGAPLRIKSLPDVVSGPAFSATTGLLHYIAERSDEIPSEIVTKVQPGNMWERVQRWLHENW